MSKSTLDTLDIDWEQLTKKVNAYYNAAFTTAAVKDMVRKSMDGYSSAVLKSLGDQFRDLGLDEDQVMEATLKALSHAQSKAIQSNAISKAIEDVATKSVSRKRKRSGQENGYIHRDWAGRRIKDDD